MTPEEKINLILRHMKKVEDNCNLLARNLMATNKEMALKIIKHGREHDLSKLDEFEFNNLFEGESHFIEALKHHRNSNPHHPEFWGTIHNMPLEYVLEMMCDVLARAQEFGTDVKEWLFVEAPVRYNYSKGDNIWEVMEKYLPLLLSPKFSNSGTQINEIGSRKV